MITKSITHVSALFLLACVLLPMSLARPLAAQTDYPIAEPFVEYYTADQRGPRVLGNVVSFVLTANGFYSQYFDKGRLESHPDEPNPDWRLSYGRLVPELLDRGVTGVVSNSSLSYDDLRSAAAPERRLPPPQAGDGPIVDERGVFVPYDPQLRAAPGHYVPDNLWAYLQQPELFPGGWLHDVGLPLTEPLSATVVKEGQPRPITVQAFERAILTDDPLNPADWRIERANLGLDYVTLLPFGSEFPTVLAAVEERFGAASDPAINWDLPLVEGDYARVYLIPDPNSATQVDAAWVYLQRQGSVWQIIAGPGTSFDAAFYSSAGIPAILQVGSDYERSLYATIRQFNPDTSVLRLIGSAGGVALVEVLTPAGTSASTPVYVYARLVDTPGWALLGPPTASFNAAFYTQNDIPAVLRVENIP